MPSDKNSNIFIGSMLKKLRQGSNMTLEALSLSCGLSKTYISQIENSRTNPSISTLKKIADAFNVPIMAILDEKYQQDRSANIADISHSQNDDRDKGEDEVFVVRKDSRKVMKYPNSDWTIELLSPNLSRKIEFILTIAEPGQSSGEEPLTHNGEEAGIVLEGKIKFTVDSREFFLEEGDSICFNSSIPHKWEAYGEKTTKTIWAITPPSF